MKVTPNIKGTKRDDGATMYTAKQLSALLGADRVEIGRYAIFAYPKTKKK